MQMDQCDFCGAQIDKFDNKAIVGSIDIARCVGRISYWRKVRTFDEGGAWCSLDHLMAWLQKELKD